MITVPMTVAEACTNALMQELRDLAIREFESAKRRSDDDELLSITLHRKHISGDLLDDLKTAAGSIGHSDFEKSIAVLQSIRAGKPRGIPNRWALVESMLAYLELNFIGLRGGDIALQGGVSSSPGWLKMVL